MILESAVRIIKGEMEELGDSEVIVLASGNLAMIYLTQWDYRLTYEEMN